MVKVRRKENMKTTKSKSLLFNAKSSQVQKSLVGSKVSRDDKKIHIEEIKNRRNYGTMRSN